MFVLKRKTIITFERLFNEWIENKRKSLKKSSISTYTYITMKYLYPELKKLNLKQLEGYDYNSIIEDLEEDYASKSVRDILVILKSILKYGNEEYGCNIKVHKIILPKLDSVPIEILSKDEKIKLEDYCIKECSLKSIGVLISLNTGMRIGEICALKWENIDLEKREIRVRFTLERIYNENLNKTEVIIDTPKSQTSIRNIPINNKLYKILKNISAKYKDSNFFLTGKDDKYIEPSVYRYNFKKILKKSKIRTIYKFHILRHTFATFCISVGMDIKTLSELLGHSSVEITLNLYVHSSYETKKKYLEKL